PDPNTLRQGPKRSHSRASFRAGRRLPWNPCSLLTDGVRHVLHGFRIRLRVFPVFPSCSSSPFFWKFEGHLQPVPGSSLRGLGLILVSTISYSFSSHFHCQAMNFLLKVYWHGSKRWSPYFVKGCLG